MTTYGISKKLTLPTLVYRLFKPVRVLYYTKWNGKTFLINANYVNKESKTKLDKSVCHLPYALQVFLQNFVWVCLAHSTMWRHWQGSPRDEIRMWKFLVGGTINKTQVLNNRPQLTDNNFIILPKLNKNVYMQVFHNVFRKKVKLLTWISLATILVRVTAIIVHCYLLKN